MMYPNEQTSNKGKCSEEKFRETTENSAPTRQGEQLQTAEGH